MILSVLACAGLYWQCGSHSVSLAVAAALGTRSLLNTLAPDFPNHVAVDSGLGAACLLAAPAMLHWRDQVLLGAVAVLIAMTVNSGG